MQHQCMRSRNRAHIAATRQRTEGGVHVARELCVVLEVGKEAIFHEIRGCCAAMAVKHAEKAEQLAA